MGKEPESGYQAEIPDEALSEALESVSKYDRQKDEKRPAEDIETLVQVEIGPEDVESGGDDSIVEQLKADLAKARQEAEETRDKMLRVAADADNIRKRALRERQEAIKFGLEGLLRELLPVIDNLQRTLAHVPQQGEDPALDALRQGVEMILQQFLNVLDTYDVKTFDSNGGQFDPKRHEAIGRKETDEAEPGTILSEMHCGYMLHDRLLRPALVTVACAPTAEADDDNEDDADDADEKQ